MYELALGAILGMSGQIVRATAGLYKARRENPHTFEFDWLLFLLGIVLGATAGVLAGFISGVDRQTAMTIFLAGYAGADFIEKGLK